MPTVHSLPPITTQEALFRIWAQVVSVLFGPRPRRSSGGGGGRGGEPALGPTGCGPQEVLGLLKADMRLWVRVLNTWSWLKGLPEREGGHEHWAGREGGQEGQQEGALGRPGPRGPAA